MKLYLNNLLSRLKQFSEDLDKKEIFIEMPWVIIDANLNQQKYIFKRDGELIMSLNGQVKIGKWEYLSAAKSLLIDRIEDKILLNQNFIDPAVMVLKKDGLNGENLILANQTLLPDLDVVCYLKKLFYKKNNISTGYLSTGEILELHNYTGVIDGNNVTIEGEPVSDGIFELPKSGRKLIIKDSKVLKVFVREAFKTDKGEITIERQTCCHPEIGDLVYKGNWAAPDGKYKLGFMRHIMVENGRIVKK